MSRWRNVLFEAERTLLNLLKQEAKRRLVDVRKVFQTKTGELTVLRGDQLVKSWLMDLERLEVGWEKDLAMKRKKKFAGWMRGKRKQRRRALSVEAIKNLQGLIRRNKDFNERCGKDGYQRNGTGEVVRQNDNGKGEWNTICQDNEQEDGEEEGNIIDQGNDLKVKNSGQWNVINHDYEVEKNSVGQWDVSNQDNELTVNNDGQWDAINKDYGLENNGEGQLEVSNQMQEFEESDERRAIVTV